MPIEIRALCIRVSLWMGVVLMCPLSVGATRRGAAPLRPYDVH